MVELNHEDGSPPFRDWFPWFRFARLVEASLAAIVAEAHLGWLLAKVLADCLGRVSNGLHCITQFSLRHPELFGPVAKLVVLTKVDTVTIRRTGLALVVSHFEASQ
jgi:hypothetical protein